MRRTLERAQVVPVPIDQAFAFFAEARNLEPITPPWLRFRIIAAPARLARGAHLTYRLRLFGVPNSIVGRQIKVMTGLLDWL